MFNQVNTWVQLSLLEGLNSLDVVDVKRCMSSTIKLVVYFEQPSRHIQVLRYQLGETVNKLLFVIDVNLTDRSGHIRQLEDLLCTALGGVQMLLAWFT